MLLVIFSFECFFHVRNFCQVIERVIGVASNLLCRGVTGIWPGIYPCLTRQASVRVVGIVCLGVNLPVTVFLRSWDLSEGSVIVDNIQPVCPAGGFRNGKSCRVILVIDLALDFPIERIPDLFFITFPKVIVFERFTINFKEVAVVESVSLDRLVFWISRTRSPCGLYWYVVMVSESLWILVSWIRSNSGITTGYGRGSVDHGINKLFP